MRITRPGQLVAAAVITMIAVATALISTSTTEEFSAGNVVKPSTGAVPTPATPEPSVGPVKDLLDTLP